MRGGSNTGMDAAAFARWLGASASLQELTLHGLQWEKIDPGGLRLETCVLDKGLRVLDLSHNGLSDASLRRVTGALTLNPGRIKSLEILLLDLNCISEEGFAAAVGLSRAAEGLRTWGFRHNKLGDGGCQALARARPRPGAWDLRTNGITSRGCWHLEEAVGDMVVARLGCNHLGDEGIAHLAAGLGERLEILDLRQAHFGDEGAGDLARSVENTPHLQQLLVSGNEIGAQGAAELALGWRWLRSLQHVDLSNNPLESAGVARVAEELPYWQQSPLRLSLVGVGCGEGGLLRLRAALQAHPRHDWQWVFDLQNNHIGGASCILDIRHLLDEDAVVDHAGTLDLE